MSNLKPIKLWGVGGPNPPKVMMVLEELGLAYEAIFVSLFNGDVKKPEYLAINPNGRIPAIYDPNTDLTLWESGAIVEYLVERYDPDRKISFEPGSNEAYLAKQWLFFQVSGQGPYYGQAVWFAKYHKEKVPSAVERYVGEIKRVTGVLEGHLAKQKGSVGDESQDGPWLVGGRFSYADLSFYMWQMFAFGGDHAVDPSEFPNTQKWMAAMGKRASVEKAVSQALAVMK